MTKYYCTLDSIHSTVLLSFSACTLAQRPSLIPFYLELDVRQPGDYPAAGL